MKNVGKPGGWPPRGTCRWCSLPIGPYDYWFWWLRRWHRSCRSYMAAHPEEVARRAARQA